ncbi:hypothetical protein BOTBODRAFT_189018, partial [Botryobasidium botryosum FD-172 SS1]
MLAYHAGVRSNSLVASHVECISVNQHLELVLRSDRREREIRADFEGTQPFQRAVQAIFDMPNNILQNAIRSAPASMTDTRRATPSDGRDSGMSFNVAGTSIFRPPDSTPNCDPIAILYQQAQQYTNHAFTTSARAICSGSDQSAAPSGERARAINEGSIQHHAHCCCMPTQTHHPGPSPRVRTATIRVQFPTANVRAPRRLLLLPKSTRENGRREPQKSMRPDRRSCIGGTRRVRTVWRNAFSCATSAPAKVPRTRKEAARSPDIIAVGFQDEGQQCGRSDEAQEVRAAINHHRLPRSMSDQAECMAAATQWGRVPSSDAENLDAPSDRAECVEPREREPARLKNRMTEIVDQRLAVVEVLLRRFKIFEMLQESRPIALYERDSLFWEELVCSHFVEIN